MESHVLGTPFAGRATCWSPVKLELNCFSKRKDLPKACPSLLHTKISAAQGQSHQEVDVAEERPRCACSSDGTTTQLRAVHLESGLLLRNLN